MEAEGLFNAVCFLKAHVFKETTMKKTLIALAVLAASGAAMAQSTAQVYGLADVWFGNTKAGAPGAKVSTTQLTSGGLNQSRWGIQGSEDLGGGLKAVFKLEQGFNLDNGTTAAANTAFSRQAYVGLAGGFGQVVLGNAWTAMDDIFGASNSGFDSALSATNNVWVASATYSSNPGNTIKYNSPAFSGLTFGASYSLDENAAVSRDIVDFSVSYAAGPVAANFAYQVQNNAVDTKVTTLNGSYDLGVAKLLASYARTDAAGVKSNDYQIGADVPLSSALTLSAGYASSKTTATARKANGWGVALGYALSKRTTVYGGLRDSTVKTAGVTTNESTTYAVGLRHTF